MEEDKQEKVKREMLFHWVSTVREVFLQPRLRVAATQQIGQDLRHSSQTLLCVQWAYLLTVLLDFEPFSFFPLLTLYLQTLHVQSDCSVLHLGSAERGR